MVVVFVEHDGEHTAEESLEAITVSREIAGEEDEALTAAIIGTDGEAIAAQLGEYGVEHVYVLASPELDPYAPEAWAAALDALIDDIDPAAVIGAGIERTQELFSRLGARRNQPMAANCNTVTVGEEYEIVRQRWGGSLLEEARLVGTPKLLTISPHEHAATPAASPATASVERVEPDLSAVDVRVRLDRVESADIEGVPLGEARVVVGGGRGVASADGFDDLETLADLLGGTVGASRAAVNEGWRPHNDQIGLTGAQISPELYIPCGISGAVQHWVGAKGAKHILAINTDPEAAIVQKADWAVIGDLHEVIPAVIEVLEARGA